MRLGTSSAIPPPAIDPATAAAAAAAAGSGTKATSLHPVPLRSLFADNNNIKDDTDREVGVAVVYELNDPEIGEMIHKSVYHAFAQVGRRHERVALEDDEFFQKDKVRRIDHARKTFRTGTRPVMRDALPERKLPLSTLLKPAVNTAPRLAFQVETPRRVGGGTKFPPVELESTDAPMTDSGAALKRGLPFPGSIPVSLMRADIARLYDGGLFYVWSWKANGLRFLLVAATFREQPMVVLINRARQIYVVPMAAPALVLDGTILDGELVLQGDGRFSFRVYDAVMTAGVPCGEYNYLVRLQNAALLLDTWPTTKDAPFSMAMKPVYAPAQIADLLEHVIPYLDHEIDGLIATAVEPPIQMGQTDTTFKHKRGTDHTIDLTAVVPKGSSEVDLLAMKTVGLYAHWATTQLMVDAALAVRLGLPSDATSDALARAIDGRIAECRYEPPTESWRIEGIRADKTMPNKLSTAWKTWQNIRENLSLLQVFPKDSVPDEVRDRLRQWEAQNPRWQKLPLRSDPPPRLVPPMAPVALDRAIQFR